MATETIVRVRHHPFTVTDYYRMAEAGILHEDDRVELIRGEIVEMAAIGNRHAAAVARLDALLQRAASGAAIIWVQNPVRLDETSEPQPDVCLLKHRDDFYGPAHPGPTEVLLLVEVADTSLAYDRAVKLPLYAQAGVPEVWIVDLEAEAIEVYRQPQIGAYTAQTVASRGVSLRCEAIPDIRVSVDEILGT